MSRETILTEPYLQSLELIALPPREVILPAGVWTPIAEPEPQRMTLTISPDQWAAGYAFSPVPYGAISGLSLNVPVVAIQIHSATFPLLIGGAWWGYSLHDGSVSVIETLRRMG